ncbi:hypothetical protein GCM10022419_134040 [Nonomuraea rosea]|uniref:Uncharacterized protein n=2 Tax=Nonomuraea rosea TaxID=638574 RepID=A0ABP7A6C3_9ACTN
MAYRAAMGFEQQLQSELAALTGHEDSVVELCGLLPPGRLIETDEGEGARSMDGCGAGLG